MPLTQNPTRGEVRAVKKKFSVREEIFAAPDPYPAGNPDPAVKDGKNGVGEDKVGFEESNPARITPESNANTLRLIVTVMAYLHGFGTLIAGVLFLLDPSHLEVYPLLSPRVAKLIALTLAREFASTGLTMLALIHQKQLRALGTLLLCEVWAEIVMTFNTWSFGFEIDVLVGALRTGFKVGLGLWMLYHESG